MQGFLEVEHRIFCFLVFNINSSKEIVYSIIILVNSFGFLCLFSGTIQVIFLKIPLPYQGVDFSGIPFILKCLVEILHAFADI